MYTDYTDIFYFIFIAILFVSLILLSIEQQNGLLLRKIKKVVVLVPLLLWTCLDSRHHSRIENRPKWCLTATITATQPNWANVTKCTDLLIVSYYLNRLSISYGILSTRHFSSPFDTVGFYIQKIGFSLQFSWFDLWKAPSKQNKNESKTLSSHHTVWDVLREPFIQTCAATGTARYYCSFFPRQRDGWLPEFLLQKFHNRTINILQ